MKPMSRWTLSLLLLTLMLSPAALAQEATWPPPLSTANDQGTAVVEGEQLLKAPDDLAEKAQQEGAASFIVAKTAPKVYVALHQPLPNPALNGTGWSSWGDICVGSDGTVYTGIGDHGDDRGGKAHTYIHAWAPETKALRRVVDVNEVVGLQEGDPAWPKVHARIVEGADKMIYFTCTLNDGGKAHTYEWTQNVPGGQIFQYNPETGETKIVGHYPQRVTPTTLVDPQRNILYAVLEGDGSMLSAFDLTKHELIYVGEPGDVTATRNIALDQNGAVYFNGKDHKLWRYDPQTHQIAPTNTSFPGQATMRSSTRISEDGYIYGTTMSPGLLFRYAPAQDKLEILGPDFLTGDYTTVTALSPDERFVYYLPGAHGGAVALGTPVVQYNIETGERKVLAFLRQPIEQHLGFVPGGTYGMKLSADGSTLYANLNGHAGEGSRLEGMNPTGFGLTSFVAVEIPESER